MFLTTPLTTCPTSTLLRNSRFSLFRSSSISFLLDTIIFCCTSSIFNILHVTSVPIYSAISPGGLTSICDAGKKIGMPTSTSNPPFIFLTTLPVTTSPSLYLSTIFSQPRIRSALRFEIWIKPVSSSNDSSITSISVPTSTSSALSNSESGIVPSDLYPVSNITLLPITPSILPLKIVPKSNFLTEVSKTASIFARLSPPIISSSSLSISS